MPPYADLQKGRYSQAGQVYHLIVATHSRRPVFDNLNAAAVVAAELDRADAEQRVHSIAWVLMPDHLHWLVQLRAGSLRDLMQRFKGRSARQVNQLISATGAVWQRGYYDHALRREEDLKSVARYIIANPLRAGLVENIDDYRWWRAMWVNGRHGLFDGANGL